MSNSSDFGIVDNTFSVDPWPNWIPVYPLYPYHYTVETGATIKVTGGDYKADIVKKNGDRVKLEAPSAEELAVLLERVVGK